MVKHLELAEPVAERPLYEWGSIAAELAGAEITLVQGRRWQHRVISGGTSGPPLVLNHGIGGHAEAFARSFRALAQHFRVYAVDAVFHGFSGKQHFDLAHMYDLLTEGYLDLLDALGLQSAHYLGESMGAQTGVGIGLQHPERVDRMVLNAGFYLNTPPDRTFPPSGHAAVNLGELSTRAVTDPTQANILARLQWLVSEPSRITDDVVSVRRRIYEVPEINASMRRVFNIDGGTFGPHLYELSYEDRDLDSWKPEALVLWGEHNPGTGPAYGEYWAERLDARFYMFADAGHWPQWEKPDEYCAAVIQFLQA